MVGYGASAYALARYGGQAAPNPPYALHEAAPTTVRLSSLHGLMDARVKPAHDAQCVAAMRPSREGRPVGVSGQGYSTTAMALISIRYSGEVILVISTMVEAGAGALKYSRRTLWIFSKCSMLRT